jgi:hypothetical protein
VTASEQGNTSNNTEDDQDKNQSNEPIETVNPPSTDADNTDSDNKSSNSSEDSEAEPDPPINKEDERTQDSTQGDESKGQSDEETTDDTDAQDQSGEHASEDPNEQTQGGVTDPSSGKATEDHEATYDQTQSDESKSDITNPANDDQGENAEQDQTQDNIGNDYAITDPNVHRIIIKENINTIQKINIADFIESNLAEWRKEKKGYNMLLIKKASYSRKNDFNLQESLYRTEEDDDWDPNYYYGENFREPKKLDIKYYEKVLNIRIAEGDSDLDNHIFWQQNHYRKEILIDVDEGKKIQEINFLPVKCNDGPHLAKYSKEPSDGGRWVRDVWKKDNADKDTKRKFVLDFMIPNELLRNQEDHRYIYSNCYEKITSGDWIGEYMPFGSQFVDEHKDEPRVTFEKKSIYMPNRNADSGQELSRITIEFFDNDLSNNKALKPTKGVVTVKLNRLTDGKLVCLEGQEHCNQAKLSCSNGDDSCKTSKIKDGIATFDGLVIHAKSKKIYTLQFNYGDITNLKTVTVNNKEQLKVNSTLNARAQVYIQNGFEVPTDLEKPPAHITQDDPSKSTSDDDQIPNTDGDTGDVAQDESNNIDSVESSNHGDKIVSITGRAIQGKTLTASSDITINGYQWHADGEKIEGANKENYTLTKNDVNKEISVSVRYQNPQGQEETSKSNKTGKIFTSKLNNISDYNDAGIENVTDDNIDSIKTAVIQGQMNREQVAKIATSYNRIMEYSYTGSDDDKPQADDYIALGIVDFPDNNLDLLNDAITLIDAELIENAANLKKAANAVDHILNKPENLKQSHFQDLEYTVTAYILPELRTQIREKVKPSTKYHEIQQLITETTWHSGVQKLVISQENQPTPARYTLNIGHWINKKAKDWSTKGYSYVSMQMTNVKLEYPETNLGENDKLSLLLDSNVEIANLKNKVADDFHKNLINNIRKSREDIVIKQDASVFDILIKSEIFKCLKNPTFFWKEKKTEYKYIDIPNIYLKEIYENLPSKNNTDTDTDTDIDKYFLAYQADCTHKDKDVVRINTRKPQTITTNGGKFRIKLEVKNKDYEVLENFNDRIHVRINDATYKNFICGEDEDNYCNKARLSSTNKMIECEDNGMSCSIAAKNGIADFEDLTLHGQKNKIYNLEFYYGDISSLDFVDHKKRLDPVSQTNHFSQLFIYDDVGNEFYEILKYDPAINTKGDIKSIKADGKSTAIITAHILNENGKPVTDKKVTFETYAGTFQKNGSSEITLDKQQDGVYTATLKSSYEPEMANVYLLIGDDEFYLDSLKINFEEQIPHSFEVENLNCHKFNNKDSKFCFITADKKQETISFSLRDQDNDLINNKKHYSILANGKPIDPEKDQDGIYKYTWNINESYIKELKLHHIVDNQTVELSIAALDEPKWIEPTNCFDYEEDMLNYIFLDVGKILGNHSTLQDLDVTINFNVETGSLRQQNNLFNNNKITIKCVLGDMPIETTENANEIIWQISIEEYEKKWPNSPQITASVNIQELEFKVKALVPITKTIFLDWPIVRLISFPLDIDEKITVGDAENGKAQIYGNILYYDPVKEKADKAMLRNFEYDLRGGELFDKVPISITSVDGSQINTYLHIKFSPDKSYKIQYYFKELDSSGPTGINTGINLHKAIISDDTKNLHKGYSGDGVTVAIAGDGIFHHQELDEIIKSELIESSQIDGIAEQSKKHPNNTNIAGIIASQVNDPSYGVFNIRGISPNVDLVNIAVVNTSTNNTQEATRTAVMKLLSDRDHRLPYFYEKPVYQKISNETNKYSLHESLKTSDINILNLNFTLSKPYFTQSTDQGIERYLWDATSRNHQLNTKYNKELYKTKFGNTIFIKGLDGYTEEKSALLSNHPAIINVASYSYKTPDTTDFKSAANWVSVPIDNEVISICYVTDGINCKNLNASNEFPERYRSGYVAFDKNKYKDNSIASAIVTGVIALMLEANSNLTWRDIKYILANTAKVSDIKNMTENEAGYKFDAQNNYGFGFIDAEAALKMASTYKKDLGDLKIKEKPYSKSEDEHINEGIFDEYIYDRVTFNIKENLNIEAITLTYKVDYNNIPSSFENLSLKVMKDDEEKSITIPSYPDQQELKITFNHFYGESSKGEWEFFIKQDKDNQVVNNIQMKMTIYGTETDISKTTE